MYDIRNFSKHKHPRTFSFAFPCDKSIYYYNYKNDNSIWVICRGQYHFTQVNSSLYRLH